MYVEKQIIESEKNKENIQKSKKVRNLIDTDGMLWFVLAYTTNNNKDLLDNFSKHISL